MMNEYLLNEDVHIYDFAKGDHKCYLFNEEPCCIPSTEIDPYLRPFADGEPISQVEKFIVATRKRQYDIINCRSDYGLKHDDTNHCFMINYPTVTCEGKKANLAKLS